MISLSSFKKDILKQIPEKENISLDPSGIYYTIKKDNKEAGIVGLIPSLKEKNSGFVQIAIIPEYRGQGILKKAETMLAEKHSLKKLYATIDKNNIPSITSHLKAGFHSIPKSETINLREKGILDEKSIRLVMNFNK
jgi:RimJ/RimL family protein N-acetyltransferase